MLLYIIIVYMARTAAGAQRKFPLLGEDSEAFYDCSLLSGKMG